MRTARNHRGGPIGKLNRWADAKRAAKALGRSLAGTKHRIHHHSTTQLVICEDHAYHMFLHLRTVTMMEGGSPRRDLYCYACKRVRRLTSYNEHGCMFCQLNQLRFGDYCDRHNAIVEKNRRLRIGWDYVSWLYPWTTRCPELPYPPWPSKNTA